MVCFSLFVNDKKRYYQFYLFFLLNIKNYLVRALKKKELMINGDWKNECESLESMNAIVGFESEHTPFKNW